MDKDLISALPPVDGLEVVAWDVAPKGLPAEPTKSHSFVAEIEKQGGVITPLVTLSQASSVIAGLKEANEALRKGLDQEGVNHWKQRDRAEAAEARISSLEEALKPFAMAADGRKSKGYGGGILFRQDVLLAARQVLEDHNG